MTISFFSALADRKNEAAREKPSTLTQHSTQRTNARKKKYLEQIEFSFAVVSGTTERSLTPVDGQSFVSFSCCSSTNSSHLFTFACSFWCVVVVLVFGCGDCCRYISQCCRTVCMRVYEWFCDWINIVFHGVILIYLMWLGWKHPVPTC